MASINDKITDVRNTARPNSARVTTARTVGGDNLACNDLTGWPTASKVHFVAYQIDTNLNVIENTQIDCSGIVSANTITNLEVLDGTDGGNSIGDVVEMLPTASWAQDLADALTNEHDREGVHNEQAIATIGNMLWPVGSIYTNANVATNPASLMGFGTWEAFGSGKVPVGYDSGDTDFDTVRETGGAKTKTLAQTNLPTGISGTLTMHSSGSGTNMWSASGVFSSSPTASQYRDGGTLNSGANSRSSLVFSLGGSSTPVSIVQPYIVVHMWRRTA